MPKKAGGKKGKGKKEEVVIETTRHILKERARCMCPILGSAYHWNNTASDIKMDAVMYKLQRAIDRGAASLDLSDAALQWLPQDLKTMPEPARITDINLADNDLFNGDQLFEVLGTLPQLRRLDLSRNFLNGALSSMCANLANLVEIKLDGNQLTELPPQVGKWESLQYISLANNEITALPTEVGAWREAAYVNLRNNKLRELPSTISAWSRLKSLLLGNNQLSAIPAEVEVMRELVELDLRKNNISVVPPELAQCTNLVKLHLGENKVSSLPGEVLGELRQMVELHLFKNRLTEVPAEIGLLVNLCRLSLSRLTHANLIMIVSNNIKSLPEEIGACTRISELYINNCAKFSGFPAAAGHLKCLQELSLKKCPALKSLPASVLEWENLKELDVRAAKKQVCKLPPELVMWLSDRKCIIRGGVPQKPKPAKGAGGKKK